MDILSDDPSAVREYDNVNNCWNKVVVPSVSGLVAIDLSEKHKKNAVNKLDGDVEEHAERKLLSPVTAIIRHPAECYVSKKSLWEASNEEDDGVYGSTSSIDFVDKVPECEDVHENAPCDDGDANFNTEAAATLASVATFGPICFRHF